MARLHLASGSDSPASDATCVVRHYELPSLCTSGVFRPIGNQGPPRAASKIFSHFLPPLKGPTLQDADHDCQPLLRSGGELSNGRTDHSCVFINASRRERRKVQAIVPSSIVSLISPSPIYEHIRQFIHDCPSVHGWSDRRTWAGTHQSEVSRSLIEMAQGFPSPLKSENHQCGYLQTYPDLQPIFQLPCSRELFHDLQSLNGP